MECVAFSHSFHTNGVDDLLVHKPVRFTKLRITVIGFCVSIFLTNPGVAFADTPLSSCQVEYAKYLELRNAYLSNPKPNGSAYKDLGQAFKQAENERARCMQVINKQFRDELEAIKKKYQSANKGKGKNSKALDRTQQSTEISNATLKRDEQIRQLATVPSLPERKAR